MWGTIEFYGTIKGGAIILPTEAIQERQRRLVELKDGTQVFERIGRVPNPKTEPQLKAFWGLFISTCINHFDEQGLDTSYLLNSNRPTGIPIYADLLKEYMYNVCPVFDEEGNRITISSNKMTIEKMSQFYDNCCDFVASQWSIHIPECNRNWKQEKPPDPFEKFRKE